MSQQVKTLYYFDERSHFWLKGFSKTELRFFTSVANLLSCSVTNKKNAEHFTLFRCSSFLARLVAVTCQQYSTGESVIQQLRTFKSPVKKNYFPASCCRRLGGKQNAEQHIGLLRKCLYTRKLRLQNRFRKESALKCSLFLFPRTAVNICVKPNEHAFKFELYRRTARNGNFRLHRSTVFEATIYSDANDVDILNDRWARTHVAPYTYSRNHYSTWCISRQTLFIVTAISRKYTFFVVPFNECLTPEAASCFHSVAIWAFMLAALIRCNVKVEFSITLRRWSFFSTACIASVELANRYARTHLSRKLSTKRHHQRCHQKNSTSAISVSTRYHLSNCTRGQASRTCRCICYHKMLKKANSVPASLIVLPSTLASRDIFLPHQCSSRSRLDAQDCRCFTTTALTTTMTSVPMAGEAKQAAGAAGAGDLASQVPDARFLLRSSQVTSLSRSSAAWSSTLRQGWCRLLFAAVVAAVLLLGLADGAVGARPSESDAEGDRQQSASLGYGSRSDGPSRPRDGTGGSTQHHFMNYTDKQILDYLVNSSRYDHRNRPEEHTKVNVSVLLLSMSSPDESSLKYEIEFLLIQKWIDLRLAYHETGSNHSHLNGLLHESHIWKPDIYFIKHGEFKTPLNPVHMSLRLFPNGTVVYTMRRHMTLVCQGNLQIFPFDNPKCPFAVESMSYEESQLKIDWSQEEENITRASSLRALNAYLAKNETGYCDKRHTWRGNYSCLRVLLVFTRDKSFYISTVFVPGIVLVTSSFISFWLDINAVPARVMIGVTTMLNFCTTTNSFRSTLPVVSNLTAMNLWDGVCMFFIYASMLEFVIVNYLYRNLGQHSRHRRFSYASSVASKNHPQATPLLAQQNNKHNVYVKGNESTQKTETTTFVVDPPADEPNGGGGRSAASGASFGRFRTVATLFVWLRRPQAISTQLPSKPRLAKAIDYFSRTVFPVLFGMFTFGFFLNYAVIGPLSEENWKLIEY